MHALECRVAVSWDKKCLKIWTPAQDVEQQVDQTKGQSVVRACSEEEMRAETTNLL